jgi:TPP-dependent pyruvate/acetoin dehydrogenase alpha subunit
MIFMSDSNFKSESNLNHFVDPTKLHSEIDISSYPVDFYLKALKRMKLIRKSEEILGENVENGKIKCPCHLSIGQEAIPVGIAQFLTSKDFVFGNHRSHGHYLSMTDDVHKLFAETLGKKTGSSKGMGGSMHVIAREEGFHGSVPIVSATIPVAVGAALTAKLKNTDSLAVTYFGDGTTEEGVFHESLNLASFYKLPILFVCENNLFSSHMHINERQPADSVARFASSHNIKSITIDGNDINSVFRTAEKAIKELRKGSGPYFIEAITYRWRGHVGADENIDVGLKRKDDLSLWKKRDPIGRLETSLLSHNYLTIDDLNNINSQIDEITKKAWNKAEMDPYPESDQLLKTVYYDEK